MAAGQAHLRVVGRHSGYPLFNSSNLNFLDS